MTMCKSRFWSMLLLLPFSICSAEGSDRPDINPFEKDFEEAIAQRIEKGHFVPQEVLKLYNKEHEGLHATPFNSLTLSHFSFIESEVEKNCSCKKSLGTCAAAIAITQKKIGSTGYVINESGLYCLAEDVVFDPAADGLAAITINADFVTLDFSQHVLTQSTDSFTNFDNTNAVVITPTHNYVTVRNGTIQLFSNMGIYAQGVNLSPTSHKGILIDDMTVLNCGKLATEPTDRLVSQIRSSIAIDGALDVVVRNCITVATLGIRADGIDTQFSNNVIVKGCQALDHKGVRNGAGISILNGRDILITDSIAERMSGLDLGPFGITTSATSNVIIDHCIANDNFTNKTSVVFFPNEAQALGISVFGPASNCIISNSTANNNFAAIPNGNSSSRGIVITNGFNNFIIDNCQTSVNTATSTNGNPVTDIASASGIRNNAGLNGLIIGCNSTENRATSTIIAASIGGIRSDGTHSNLVIENSVAEANVAEGLQATGGGIFVVTGNGIVIKNCHAIGNLFKTTFDNLDTPSGIGLFNSQNALIEDSTALRNQAEAGSVQTRMAGISVFGTATLGIAIRKSIASGQSAPLSVTRVAGILISTTNATDDKVLVEDCVAENNLNAVMANQGVGINFIGIQGSTIVRSVSKGNGRGIFLEPTGGINTTRCIVQANDSSANLVSGFEDTNSVKNNAYFNNVAYNPAAPVGANYVTLPANTPIRLWTIGSTPVAPVAGDIDNMDLR